MLQQEDTLSGILALRIARIAKYSKRYKLTLHHRRRSGEDVQGTLDSGHIFPPSLLSSVPTSSFSLLLLLRLLLLLLSGATLARNSRAPWWFANSHYVELPLSLSSRQGYVVLVLVRFHVAKEGALSKDRSRTVTVWGLPHDREGGANKVKRGLKNVTLSVECGLLTANTSPPLARLPTPAMLLLSLSRVPRTLAAGSTRSREVWSIKYR